MSTAAQGLGKRLLYYLAPTKTVSAAISVAFAALVVHLIWARIAHSGVPLARCGAFWQLIGMIIIARQIMRLGYRNWLGVIIWSHPFISKEGFDPD
jgi:hypothetical protein